ncbi:hypothetical protein QYF36_020820 [Acer negundo]|nr:hypothetical protein QYF36_020820 [Acer negundo]
MISSFSVYPTWAAVARLLRPGPPSAGSLFDSYADSHLAVTNSHLATADCSRKKPKRYRALESDHGGNTALHLACVQGNLDVVKTVIECHPQLCLMKNKDKRIPQHIAVMRGRDDLPSAPFLMFSRFCGKRLRSLTKIICLIKVDCQGNSLLHYAVLYNQLWIVKTCLTDQRCGPLAMALQSGLTLRTMKYMVTFIVLNLVAAPHSNFLNRQV